MLSARFIALVVASIATLAIATPTIAAPEPDATGDVIVACRDLSLGGLCTTVPFIENVCVTLPGDQVNEMTSVQVPGGWACTFYDLRGSIACNAQTSPNTILLAPGSSDLRLQNFDNVADNFICNRILIIIKIVVIVEPQYTVSFSVVGISLYLFCE
ncbi:hypothetical protein B0H14DRAFT_3496273 [Mycena olivaceomarginata]|nr:hypothetical protein B0H14DRAFT_3496273 [Mycena olivaceomarginata]